jgi:ADP-heptose:LPS heptosyltransferase
VTGLERADREAGLLVLRALGLGDLLTAVPALRALRRRFATRPIILAAPAALAPLVARTGAVDRLLDVPSAVRTPPGPLPPATPRPWLAVNLHGAGPQSTDALLRLAPTRLWAFGPPDGPPWQEEEHEVDRWCRLVAWYACEVDRDDLYLDVGPTGPRLGPVLVHPGAAEAERRWPADRFASVARTLADRGLPVLVTAGPEERPLAAWVAARAGLAAGSVAGSMDLDSLADLVAGSRLVVCGDTGIAHLATAFRTPSVVIFGSQSPARWGPPANGRHRVLWSPSPQDAVPNTPGPHPALLRTEPADVVAAAESLLTAGLRD